VRAAISKALTPAALPGLAKGSSFALSLSDRAGFNEGTPFSVRSPILGYDDCIFLCAVWDKETLAKEYNMKIMAEPVVHESADKDLLAGRALQLLTVFHSVFAHIRDAQDRLLWSDKTFSCTYLAHHKLESVTVNNVRKGCSLPGVA